ncbi:T9SS type A sorting domain-containing protein [Chitinophaga japonensis]|uniref:Putative secreted protein (Por secretion system target) n=1 Tax=Chitinophaga japonensis TaxID=104662 RepID=A0A562TCE8_CHIJA|nr:T9SS type A sorting domain-containing protein [Chitinophaga japonensis]TWI90670.1 putative secreted protein (Por secretion system target) [Chitinophaga japonensis]
MKTQFTLKSLFALLFFIHFQSQLFSQSISGPATVCPNAGTVRYTFNNASPCSNLQWQIQGGQVTIINQVNNYIDLQFPAVPSDVTYRINVGYICTAGNGNTSRDVLVKAGPTIATLSRAISCGFQGNYTFDIDVVPGTWTDVQWTTNTGWVPGSEWHDPGTIEWHHKEYTVNNLNGGYVKAVVLGTGCSNAPIYELTYNITRSPDNTLPAPAFTSGSATGVCGTSVVNVAVTPPPGSVAPTGYRWYSTPANVLKINGGVHNDASTALLTSTPSVNITVNGTQSDVAATVYVSAEYPGGCNTAFAPRQINVAGTVPAAPTVTSTLLSDPGEPTEYLFTATPMSNVIYDWYLSGGTLVKSSTENTFDEYFPCRVSRTYYCIVRNSCGSSAPSNSVTRTGGCRDRERVSNFTISPNPATNIVTIAVKENPVAKSAETSSVASFNEVNIYDFNGNLVKRQQYAPARQGTIDVGNLRTGTYYIEIKNGQYTEKQTLIIQK